MSIGAHLRGAAGRSQVPGGDIAVNYKDAGVDIGAGDALVEAIKPLADSTRRAGVVAGLGGFGGLFDLAAAGYRDPVLVAASDGVGTKLEIAAATGRHDSIGIDLVAMCVNDLVVQGAEPLFFLDYFAAGRLTDVARTVIGGIAEGCRQAGCALIGGETAEMPGLYGAGRYDLAGFAVGAVERGALLPRGDAAIVPGDAVLGLAADGLHANGFSLVRKLVAEAGLAWDGPAPFDAAADLGTALLTPTRIYVGACRAAAALPAVKAFAHITGGGLSENIPRVLPRNCAVDLTLDAAARAPVLAWLARSVAPTEMVRTFNCGVGMVVITSDPAAATAVLRAHGETVVPLGRVVTRQLGEPRVAIRDLESLWPA